MSAQAYAAVHDDAEMVHWTMGSHSMPLHWVAMLVTQSDAGSLSHPQSLLAYSVHSTEMPPPLPEPVPPEPPALELLFVELLPWVTPPPASRRPPPDPLPELPASAFDPASATWPQRRAPGEHVPEQHSMSLSHERPSEKQTMVHSASP